MWNQKAVDHLKKQQNRKQEQSEEFAPVIPDIKSLTKPEQPKEKNEEYDAFAESIRHSLGLASIMNKYNLTQTSDMKEYKHKDICVKTQKIKKDENDPTKGGAKKKKHRMGQDGENNTLVFVKKRNKLNRAVYEKDYMSEIVDRGMRPMDFLMSKKQPKLDDEEKTVDSTTTKGKFFQF